MSKPASLYIKTCIFTLGVLTFWFLAVLAMAEPRCANCALSLVRWAMPRAEFLAGGWLIVGMGGLWYCRRRIAAFCSSYGRYLRHRFTGNFNSESPTVAE